MSSYHVAGAGQNYCRDFLSFHLYKDIKKKRRLREVNYLFKATQLASGRARIRPRQSRSCTPGYQVRPPPKRRKEA